MKHFIFTAVVDGQITVEADDKEKALEIVEKIKKENDVDKLEKMGFQKTIVETHFECCEEES